jgi:crotonobetainyl-CoA:carnitine CoA-transferase CaiB-like acyl-CoA transferase
MAASYGPDPTQFLGVRLPVTFDTWGISRTKERRTAEWLQRLDANDVPSAPVLRRNEVIANEQVLARELIAEFDHPDIGRVRQPKPAARFDRTPAQIPGPAPRIGEHSASILAELGFGAAEIERLATEKIVRLVKT